MKYYKYIWILLVSIFLAACKEDEPAPIASVGIKDAKIEASYHEANISWRVMSNATISEVIVEYAADSAFVKYEQAQMALVNPKKDNNLYSVVLKPLKEGSPYFLRCRVLNKINSYASKPQLFITKAYSPPKVSTDSITDVMFSSARLHATLIVKGTDSIPEVGFCVATHKSVTIADSCIVYPQTVNKDSLAYAVSLDKLADNTTYYVCAYAKNSKGVAYGKELSFTTKEIGTPQIGNTTISNITYTTATATSEVLADGGSSIIERGVCYSPSAEPSIENNKITSGSGLGSFSCNLTELTAGTTYYVRAYATNSKGTFYGEQTSFTTADYGLPTVATSEASNISYTSSTCGGIVKADGDQTVTERGICYSTSHNPTISNNKVTSGKGLGTFTCDITNLTAGTTYYVRAYATNSQGTSYGNEVSFTTTAYGLPTVITSTVTNITATTATCGGNVTDDGGQTVSERGICYSTSQNPTVSNSKVKSGSSTGSFTCNLTGLTDGTTYNIRAYAINSKGISYGNEVSFTTTAYDLPTVTTSTVTNISYTTATCGGNVTDDGGQNVTERGICYSTSQNPTVSDTKISSGEGIGSFTCKLTELVAGTMYYIRAYAVNSKGTSYGSEVSFTTTSYGLPTVITSTITNITATSATCGGDVTDDGGQSVTERGICYSTSQNPTVSDTKISSGEGVGAFTCNLTELIAGTMYYVRAYAVNSKGTSYGNEISFTTQSTNGAILCEFSVSDTKKVRFSKGNLQYQASTNTWRFATNQYDVIGGDNANISSSYAGWIDLFGLGTSGFNEKFPYLTSTNYHDYCDGYYYNIANTNYDWGVYNAISNGGNQPNLWRTLTGDECKYICSGRTNAQNLISICTINNIKGILLLPDDWLLPSGLLWTPTINDWTVNIYTQDEWHILELSGAIFLPYCGERYGIEVTSVNEKAFYRCTGGYSGFYGNMSKIVGGVAVSGVCQGWSVRLVQDVQ